VCSCQTHTTSIDDSFFKSRRARLSPQFQPSDDRGASIQPAGSRTWLTPVHWRVQNRLKACSSNFNLNWIHSAFYLYTVLVLCVENARGSCNKGSVVNVIFIWFPDFVRCMGFRKKKKTFRTPWLLWMGAIGCIKTSPNTNLCCEASQRTSDLIFNEAKA
jgi:hypothetical protein